MRVRFKTFGCRLNRAEALQQEAEFLAAGWEIAERSRDADLIIVRGCSVTSAAQKECEALLAALVAKYPAKRVVATGCLARKKNEYLLDPRAAAKLHGVRSGDAAAADTAAGEDPLPSRTARAWLKVQDGCDSRCSFCIVPQLRGRAVSVPFGDVIGRARRFADAGYREIVVTGCNLAQYSSGGRDIADLAAALAETAGCRFRFGSVEPGPAAARLVDAMAAHGNICRFLHLSVQSASDGVLAAMRRPYRAAGVYSLAAAACKAMPDIALGCDVIAGFPGESEGDFAATLAMFDRIPFSKAHVFPYSERPGTAAEGMGCAVPREVRSARARMLAAAAAKLRRRFAARFKGRIVEIVVEDAEKTAGWTGEYLWCEAAPGFAAGRGRPARKSLVRMKVARTSGDTLEGDPL